MSVNIDIYFISAEIVFLFQIVYTYIYYVGQGLDGRSFGIPVATLDVCSILYSSYSEGGNVTN